MVTYLTAATISLATLSAASPGEVVLELHAAFLAGDRERAAATLGPSLVMFDTDASGGVATARPHLYLEGDQVREWAVGMIEEAGPHAGALELVETRTRQRAAIVVTRGSGSNRFRRWNDETTVWLLGESAAGWRIVGFSIVTPQLPAP